jgi:predicted nucleic acid-binding protein
MIRARSRSALPAPSGVLIDTGAFHALSDTSDIHHATAITTFDDLAAAGTRLFTTDFIVAETHALILARLRRMDRALEFINSIYASQYTTIVDVTRADQQQAVALLNRYSDKRFSFTDATNFVVMERLALTHAFTFDRNFAQYGVHIIPAMT